MTAAAAPPLARGASRRLGVSGCYAGPLTRLLAFAADSAFITASYAVIIAVLGYVVPLLTSDAVRPSDISGLWWAGGLVVWTFSYMFISLLIAARTPGKTLVGLRIVSRDGSPLRPGQALRRVVAEPFTFLTFGLGFAGLVIGRERRALHDVAAGTAVVYDWGDRPAEMPGPLSRVLAQSDYVPDDLSV